LKTNIHYSDEFREQCFIEWYNLGKPVPASYVHNAPTSRDGRKPSIQSIINWIPEWRERAEILDEEVRKDLEKKLVAEKSEMLKRHAVVGKKMQDIALEYLDDPDVISKLSPNSATRLLVEGLKIERISVGMPDVLEDVMTKTDEELLDDITKLITSGKSEFIQDNDD
jgi:hypothetical protein